MQKNNAVPNVPAQSHKKLALVILTLASTVLASQANAVGGTGGIGLESPTQGVHSLMNTIGAVGLE